MWLSPPTEGKYFQRYVKNTVIILLGLSVISLCQIRRGSLMLVTLLNTKQTLCLQRCFWRSYFIPDSSLKEVKLISICTFTSPQPFTKSLKSSAVKSSSEFFGSTSRRPFLIALKWKQQDLHYIRITFRLGLNTSPKSSMWTPLLTSKFIILLAVLFFQSFAIRDANFPKQRTAPIC